MTLDEFKASTEEEPKSPPEGLSECLQALWFARAGDWHRAHELAQSVETTEGSLVHAYLHRVEGDISNARYWYSRAGRPPQSGPLEEEWAAIAEELL